MKALLALFALIGVACVFFLKARAPQSDAATDSSPTPIGNTGPSFNTVPSANQGPSFAGNDSEEEISKLFGPLSSALVACFSMDNRSRGSVVYSPANNPVLATFNGLVRFNNEDERLSADFSRPNTSLRVITPFTIGPAYTFAVWLKLPLPNRHGVVWQSAAGAPLYLTEDKFMCWTDRGHEFCSYDSTLTGWHHVAITCDGQQTSFYLDGALAGTAPAAVDGSLKTVGNHMLPQEANNSQCDQLDDMFVFSRALTPPEISTLLPVRLPLKPSPAGASFPASQSAKSELVREYRDSLVFVSGEGAGSGFIVNLGGKSFLATNAHVAAGVKGAGFKTLEGQPVQAGAASVAVGHDIFVMQAPASGHPLEVMRGVEENTAIGDEVVVLGNAEGAGVINTIGGRIVGVGPNLVEIDAPFQPGNSGSPIIHLKSKKVVGVATYLTIRKYDPATKEPVKDPVIRRFGYRLDSVKTWQPINWQSFYAQAAEARAIEMLTDDLITFINDLARDARVTRDMHTNPAIRTRVDAWLNTKNKHMSPTDRKAADQNFLSFLKITCQADLLAANQRLTYDYFQRGLVEQQKDRTFIADIFTRIINSIQRER